MGQYYVIANMDKKEVLCIDDKIIGGKLIEISLARKNLPVFLNQMADAWKGDTIFVVGDYANLEDSKEPFYNALREWTDKLHLTGSLYNYIIDNFTKVNGIKEDMGYRYIYNHTTKEYIDIEHCPSCRDETDYWTDYVMPLYILLAMGNGRGNGDYCGDNSSLAGTWCDYIRSIEVTKEPIDKLKYKEIHPDFRF